MGNPLRDTDPAKIHHISNRTENSTIWMVPSARLNGIIGGVLARYQEIFSIRIFAYAILGNHFHLLVQAPDGHLDEFMENVNREIAKRVNRYNNRKGRFWARRYSDQTVPVENDEIRALLYVTTNPTKHGLISHSKKWPGLICYQQLLDGAPRRFRFTHYSRIQDDCFVETEHNLVISYLPQFAALKSELRTEKLSELIEARTEEYRQQRKREGKGFLTRGMILRQAVGSTPKVSARSPRPSCYSDDPQVVSEFRIQEKLRKFRYVVASHKYRSGIQEVVFPSHSFKPPLHRKPRLYPFGHLSRQLSA